MSAAEVEAFPDPVGPVESGQIIVSRDGCTGSMWIHVSDPRHHPFPDGWHPLNPEPEYVGDYELWFLYREE